MDAMAFGMGCCCLQVTFQARDLDESRFLYDQLSVLSPIVLALTAASPVFKGRLVDTDTRWDVIASSVDCRTRPERGLTCEPEWMSADNAGESAGEGRRRILKSRYDSIDTYISTCDLFQEKYNDIPLVIDEEVRDKLMEGGLDASLANHLAHLFIRDPLVVFSERVKVDDDKTSEHFENIQSTNWQNVRWKPPPPHVPDMGWRVELRTMEVQLTDFENAAFTVFSVLMSRVILFFRLNLYVPISKVDHNMAAARTRDAITEQKFYFRKVVAPLTAKCGHIEPLPADADPDEYVLMTIEEILLGKGLHFPGLITLIFAYLDIIECDPETRVVVERYLRLIVDRARGHLMTAAQWLRKKFTTHPDYKNDSVVTDAMAYDVLKECRLVGESKLPAPELLGSLANTHYEPHASKPRRMRGASFADEVFSEAQCAVVRGFVEQHTVGKSFKETTPFLRFPADEEPAPDADVAAGAGAE